jgi:signal transduction histidine kinase/CheY-like chemotaxis protein
MPLSFLEDYPFDLLCLTIKDKQIFICDNTWNIVYASNNFLGYLKSEFADKNLSFITKAALTASIMPLKTIFLHKDGRKMTFDVEIKLTKNEQNMIIIYLSNDDAHKMYFMANMSHEIRTPLNGILGMIQLLEKTHLTDTQKEYLDIISDSGQNLLMIINDILDVTKLEARQIYITKRPFLIRKCIENSIDILMIKATQKNLNISYTIDNDVPHCIISDFNRLRQILMNILSNAIKFTSINGDIKLKVTSKKIGPAPIDTADHVELTHTENLNCAVSMDTSNTSSSSSGSSSSDPETEIEQLFINNKQPHLGDMHSISFSVTDTGIGISKSDENKLFHSFTQLDQTSTKSYQGTGLGLYICKQLCDLLGGNIHLESSQVNVGSTFVFNIVGQEFIVPPTNINSTNELYMKKVLIVDDNLTNRMALCNIILSLGMLPTVCSSGQEAMIYIESNYVFDIGILDIQMPIMNGITLAKRIKKIHPLLPLIALSSLGQIVDKKTSLFNYFLIKPVKNDKLINSMVNSLKCTEKGAKIKKISSSGNNITNEKTTISNYNMNILIVEDIRTNQIVLQEMLNSINYHNVTIASDGFTAYDLIKKYQYDVILLDLKMPGMSGMTLAEKIRKITNYKTYIIAVTAAALQSEKDEYLKDGLLDDYITKPINLHQLEILLSKIKI